MGVFALKKLMKDIQEVCEIGGKHMNIAMPSLLKTHATKHQAIHGDMVDVDDSMAAYARQTARDIGDLPDQVGDLRNSLQGRRSVRDAVQSLKDQHADIELRRANGEKDVPLSDVEKLANQYAKRVLGHYSDPSDLMGMAKTAGTAALAELKATFGEDVAPELRNAAIEHIFNETVAGSVTVNGHDITLEEFKAYVEEVKK